MHDIVYKYGIGYASVYDNVAQKVLSLCATPRLYFFLESSVHSILYPLARLETLSWLICALDMLSILTHPTDPSRCRFVVSLFLLNLGALIRN